MIDPIISLAYSMHSNKGVYALLLGSGVSRAAGIPTGWEVVLDLVRKLAHLSNEDCEPNPGKWYADKFSAEPDYSNLLAQLAKTAPERNQLLRSYFEPSDSERDEGLKAPTAAHKSIAQLVASAHIRVIVTTNFDRLLERAIEEVGITPTVISTPDASAGALPIIHTRCTIIKVHGDYLDTRIKNAPDELAKFDKRLNRLLDRVFDEFGLIVCGWSADWDTALRNSVARCPSRRFSTYWTHRDKLSDAAARLVQLRGATTIQIDNADTFFQQLSGKLAALDEFEQPHPLSVRTAAVLTKKYLEEDRYRIRLHDLIIGEVRNVLEILATDAFSVNRGTESNEEFKNEFVRRVQYCESLIEVLQAMVINGAYWGGNGQNELWVSVIQQLCSPLSQHDGHVAWLKMRIYPALITLYSAGIAALAGRNYGALAAILSRPINRYDERPYPLLLSLSPFDVMEVGHAQLLPDKARHFTPLNDRLFETLEIPLKGVVPDSADYRDIFERFEYLYGLVYADINSKILGRSWWAPIGQFGWRYRHNPERHVLHKFTSEIEASGSEWPLLQAGLFDGSIARLREVKDAYDSLIARAQWY